MFFFCGEGIDGVALSFGENNQKVKINSFYVTLVIVIHKKIIVHENYSTATNVDLMFHVHGCRLTGRRPCADKGCARQLSKVFLFI